MVGMMLHIVLLQSYFSRRTNSEQQPPPPLSTLVDSEVVGEYHYRGWIPRLGWRIFIYDSAEPSRLIPIIFHFTLTHPHKNPAISRVRHISKKHSSHPTGISSSVENFDISVARSKLVPSTQLITQSSLIAVFLQILNLILYFLHIHTHGMDSLS